MMEIDISPKNNLSGQETERRFQRAMDDLYEEAIVYENDLKVESKEKIRLHKKSERANSDWKKEREKSRYLEVAVAEKEKILSDKQAEIDDLKTKIRKLTTENESLQLKVAKTEKSSSSSSFSQNGDESSQKIDYSKFPNFSEGENCPIDPNLCKNANEFLDSFKTMQQKLFADFHQNFGQFVVKQLQNGEKMTSSESDSKLIEKDAEISRLKSENETLKDRMGTREKNYIQEIEVVWHAYNSVLMQGHALMDP